MVNIVVEKLEILQGLIPCPLLSTTVHTAYLHLFIIKWRHASML